MKERFLTLQEISSRTHTSVLFLKKLIDNGTISSSIAKKVLAKMFENPEEPSKIIEANGWIQISDEGAIKEVVMQVLADNAQSVAD